MGPLGPRAPSRIAGSLFTPLCRNYIATSGSMPTSHRWRRYLQHTYTGLSKNWHFLKLHNSFGGKLMWQRCLLNQTFSLYHKNDATFRISHSNFWAPQITNSKALLPTLSQNYRNGHCHFGTPCVSVSGGKSAARTKHKREVTKKIAAWLHRLIISSCPSVHKTQLLIAIKTTWPYVPGTVEIPDITP